MNSLVFCRILWKECRAQFSLWLALVIGALVLQATILATQGRHTQALGFVLGTSFVLTACFTVASLAILFAGETEEGTREWLRQLPVRPLTLVGGKLAFAFFAALLLLVAMWGTGLLATWLSDRTADELFGASGNLIYVQSLAGAFAWGLFFAVRCRRVLHAVLWAVLAEILVVRLTDDVISQVLGEMLRQPQYSSDFQSWLYFGITAGVLMAAIASALRWARTSAGSTAAVSTRRAWRAPTLPWAQQRERAWRRLAQRASALGSPDARATAVLAWREAHEAVPFAFVWLLLGLLATGQAVMAALPVWFVSSGWVQVVYLIATPAVCGLVSCLGDQRQQVFRFLGERGVSPARVWCVKQGVWLSLAVVLVAAGLRWQDSPAPPRGTEDSRPLLAQLMSEVRVPSIEVLYRDRPAASPEDRALRRSLVASLLAALFAAGQCASFWIRRAVLAGGMLLIAAPAIFAWHAILVALDIPFWLGSWPLTLALLAATLCGAGAWLRGRDSWKLRFTRLAAVALPVIAVTAAAAAHRACSVPEPAFERSMRAEVNARVQSFDDFSAEWSARWRTALQPFSWSNPQLRTFEIPPERRASVRQKLIDLGEQIPRAQVGLDPLVYSPDSRMFAPWIGEFLANPGLVDANGLPDRSADSIEEQWRGYAAGLRITRYLSAECQSGQQWIECLRAQGPLLRAIQEWAARPDQTAGSLQQAFDVLVDELQEPPTARDMLINRYVFYSQLLEHRGRKWPAFERDFRESRSFEDNEIALAPGLLPGFERERMRRLLGHVTLSSLTRLESPSAVDPSSAQQIVRWSATTQGLPVHGPDELTRLQGGATRLVVNTFEGAHRQWRTRLTGTAVVIALQRYRLSHGGFPATLRDAVSVDLTHVLIDPYSNAAFGYEPGGLSADLYLDQGRAISAGQPLLWTTGLGRGWVRPSVEPLPVSISGDVSIPPGAYVTGTARLSSIGGFTVEPAEPNRVKFINAGDDGW